MNGPRWGDPTEIVTISVGDPQGQTPRLKKKRKKYFYKYEYKYPPRVGSEPTTDGV